jgi:hypothetical protein
MKLWVLMLALTISVLPLGASDLYAALRAENPSLARAETREVRDEADPTDQQSCYSMGQINLAYESGEVGAPNVGLRITDPRGRKIGYDPLAHKGWQEFPLAEGFLDCDENEDTGELRHCAGYIQICGPVSGTYQVDVLPAHSGKYSIHVLSTSEQTRDELGVHSTGSRVEWNSKIQDQAPATLLLQYSREAGAQLKLLRSDQPVAGRNVCCSSRPASP